MTRLEELIIEKRKIERQIAEIKQANMSVDGAMICFDHNVTTRKEWCLRVRDDIDRQSEAAQWKKERYATLVRSENKQYVISAIDTYIGRLTALKEKINNQNERNVE